jgi:cytochrome c-type biogenesis protein CcmH/NrfG
MNIGLSLDESSERSVRERTRQRLRILLASDLRSVLRTPQPAGFLLDTLENRLLDFLAVAGVLAERSATRRLPLKRETVWVAIICLVLGAFIGYLLGAQITWKEMQQAAAEHRHDPPPKAASGNLPEGHPPITTAADFEALKKAVEAAPQNAALVTNLANKYYDSGRYEEAIRYYQQALSLDPNNVGIITDLGTAFFYSGRPDEAITHYNRSLQIDSGHVQSLHNLVIVNLQGKKDSAAARAALTRLKSADPSNQSIANLEAMLNQASSSAQAPQSASNPRQRIF